MSHLLDPAIALPMETDFEAQSIFWVRFMEWERDTRVLLGSATYLKLSDFYANIICPEPEVHIPRGMQNSVHRAVRGLLSRPPHAPDRIFYEHTITPPYRGASEHHTLLRRDLGESQHSSSVILGTSSGSWDEGTASAYTNQPPPHEIILAFNPNLPTATETTARRTAHFREIRLLIVGGRSDPRIRSLLHEKLGIEDSNLLWEPCEKSKPPRNIEQQISGLANTPAIVICITGRVSHAISDKVKANCSRSGVELLLVKSAANLLPALIAIADRGL